jgi:hypothetical protein
MTLACTHRDTIVRSDANQCTRRPKYRKACSYEAARLNRGNRCKFPMQEVVGDNSEDKKLCKALLTEGPPYVQFAEDHQFDPRTNDLVETSVRKAAMIDVSNDGKELPIIELNYASGASAGCDYDYFDMLSPDRTILATDPTRDLLVKMQGFNEHSRHPVPRCRGNETGWFQLNGVTYYKTKYRGNYPKDALSSFHEVSFIQDKTIHRTCEFVYKPKTRVN